MRPEFDVGPGGEGVWAQAPAGAGKGRRQAPFAKIHVSLFTMFHYVHTMFHYVHIMFHYVHYVSLCFTPAKHGGCLVVVPV